MHEKFENSMAPQEDKPEKKSGIDVEEMPFVYNKRFNPFDSESVEKWQKLRPEHITQEAWDAAIEELKESLLKSEYEIMKSWKEKNGLYPKK